MSDGNWMKLLGDIALLHDLDMGTGSGNWILNHGGSTH